MRRARCADASGSVWSDSAASAGPGAIARRLSVRGFRRARTRARLPPQRRARRRRPRLHLLVALGVAVERAFEISQRDHEPRPAVAVAVLEQVVLEERPDSVPQRPRHGHALASKLAHAERGVAVHLADDLLEAAKRKLPDGALQLPQRPLRQELIAFVHGIVVVAHRVPAEELRLTKVGIPARALDPAPHHVVAARHQIGVVRGRRSQDRKNLVADLGRAALVGIQTEDPLVPALRDRAIAQVAETLERNLHYAGPEALRDLRRSIARKSVV